MFIWNWLNECTGGHAILFTVLLVCAWLSLLCGALSIVAREISVLLTCVFFVFGGVLLTLVLTGAGLRFSGFVLSGTLFFEGVLCLLITACLCGLTYEENNSFSQKPPKKKRRDLEYALPQKDNEYIRSRLNTVLHTEELSGGEEDGYKETVRLSYARKLLARVKQAPLSVAERLETEEISRIFALYLSKSDWKANEYRTVNELFSVLLKLSAKYCVAV